LLVGMHLAAKPASERFPFGRASERYFWPFVVAVMLLSVGGAFAVFQGVEHLVNPMEHPQALGWSYAVLGISLAMEGMSFRVAIQEFRKLVGDMPIQDALLGARDPTIPLVLAEDATAIAGLVVALVAVGLNGVTGQKFWDPIGSIIIGLLLCAVALVLAKITHGLLIGESATRENQAQALELASSVEGVNRVTQLLTMHLGPDVVLLAMKVAFLPTLRVAEVEEVTDRIEARIRSEMPQMRKIFIEADSDGDLRGIPTPSGPA
jgi:cation diffusion facilitator family transporter